MDQSHFQAQIKRMCDVYGKKHYQSERTAILWRAVEKIENDIFTAAVDELIANERVAPMAEKVLNAVKIAEDRLRAIQKDLIESRAQSAKEVLEEAYKATRNKSFAKDCLDLLEKFQKGQITRKEFEKGCDLLEEAANLLNPPNKNKCAKCDGFGYVCKEDESGYSFVHRCNCSAGKQYEQMYAPSDKAKQNPIALGVLQKK